MRKWSTNFGNKLLTELNPFWLQDTQTGHGKASRRPGTDSVSPEPISHFLSPLSSSPLPTSCHRGPHSSYLLSMPFFSLIPLSIANHLWLLFIVWLSEIPQQSALRMQIFFFLLVCFNHASWVLEEASPVQLSTTVTLFAEEIKCSFN